MIYLESFKREFKSIFKYKGMMILLFIGPIFLTLYFGGVYCNDYVNDIPIAVLDEDNSSLSNLVTGYFLTSERFDVTNYPASRDELQKLIDEGMVQMGICIPGGFERDVTTYKSSQILAVTDGSNIVVANNAYAQATMIAQSVSAGVEMKLIQGKGMTPRMAQNIALVYNLGERILYDPKMTYMNYLIICFLAIFFQQLMLSSMGSTFIRDSEYIAEGNVPAKIFGAVSACFVGILPSILLSIFAMLKLFHVPITGSMFTVTVLTIFFTLSIIGPSLLIASVAKDKVKYSQFEFMLSLPTFVSSGCVWPMNQMPKLLEIIVRACWPLANYAKVVQAVLVKGMNFKYVIPNILQLAIFSLVWLPAGIVCYKRTFCRESTQENVVSVS